MINIILLFLTISLIYILINIINCINNPIDFYEILFVRTDLLLLVDFVLDILPMHDPSEKCETLKSVAPSLRVLIEQVQ